MKVVHCKKEQYDVYIGRPSKWANPYTHIQDRKTLATEIVASREEAISRYRSYILHGEGQWLLDHLSEIDGKTLGCWCCQKPSHYTPGMQMVCHGEVLMEIIFNLKNNDK